MRKEEVIDRRKREGREKADPRKAKSSVSRRKEACACDDKQCVKNLKREGKKLLWQEGGRSRQPSTEEPKSGPGATRVRPMLRMSKNDAQDVQSPVTRWWVPCTPLRPSLFSSESNKIIRSPRYPLALRMYRVLQRTSDTHDG